MGIADRAYFKKTIRRFKIIAVLMIVIGPFFSDGIVD